MKTINLEEITNKTFIDYGGYSNVYKIEVDKKTYCYKEFTKQYDKDILENIIELSEENFIKEFITPLYIVLKNKDCIGYITNYYGTLFDIDHEYNLKLQIKLLKDFKRLLEILHNYYKRIHGDINRSNLVYNNSNKNFIIDFDRSLKIGSYPISNMSLNSSAIEYLKYYKFDINIDKFLFNKMTLSILCQYDIVFKLNENKDIKRLSKELLLTDTKKNISNEYIIDYI